MKTKFKDFDEIQKQRRIKKSTEKNLKSTRLRITVQITQEMNDKLKWILSKGDFLHESEIHRRALNIGLNEMASQINQGCEDK